MSKTYDGLFVLEASRQEEAVENLLARIRSELVRMDGEVVEEEKIGKKFFARPMRKHDSGLYVRLRFRMDPAQIDGLRKRYRLFEGLLRVRILLVDPALEKTLAEQKERRAAHEASVREAAGGGKAEDQG